MNKKIYVIIIGTIFSFFLIEALIRINGYVYKRSAGQSESPLKSDEFRILCIGNSHTAGIGVEKDQAYPAVLEKKLNRIVGNGKIRVINRGLAGANTSVLLDALPEQIAKIKPHLVLIMTGEPNLWSWYGFSRFVNDKTSFKNLKTNSLINNLINLLSHSRVFRLVKILSKNKILASEYSQYTDLEKVMYAVSITMDERWENMISDEDAHVARTALESYILNDNLKEIKNRQDFYRTLYLLHIEHFNDLNKGLELIQRSISDSNTFNTITHFDIVRILNQKSNAITPEARKKLNQLKTAAELQHPGDKIYNDLLTIHLGMDTSKVSLQRLRLAQRMIPGSGNVHKKLIDRLEANGRITNSERANLYINAIESSPFSVKSSLFTRRLLQLFTLTEDTNLKNKIATFFTRFKSSYPHAAEGLSYLSGEALKDWIAFDVGQMIDLLQKSNIQILIQNYHWLRDNHPQGIHHETMIDESLRRVAKQRNIPFSDTHEYYMNEIMKSGMHERAFFTTRLGPKDNHPSILGHQIIANKLALDILKYKFIH